jgi:tetratricopeptide (TPR) repeat protein
VLKQQRKFDEAENLYLQELAHRIKQLGIDHPSTLATRYNLASLYLDTDKAAKAEPLLAENVTYCVKKLGPEHVNTLLVKHHWAIALMNTNQPAKAEPLFREILKECQGRNRIKVAVGEVELNLGFVLMKLKQWDEATRLLTAAYAAMVKQPDTGGYRAQLPRVAGWLAEIAQAQSKLDDVTKWKSEAARWSNKKASP